MSLKVKVRVPATTANMGPGFDCLGMALALYNEVEFEVEVHRAVESGRGPSLWPSSSSQSRHLLTPESSADSVAAPESKNLIYRSFVTTLSRLGVIPKSVRHRMLKTTIPVARGLGSSAACIVAGVLAAREAAARFGAREMSLSDAIDLATEIEGHPDNVVPAALGGLTVAVWRVDASAASGDRAAGSLGPSEEGLGDGPPSGEPRRRVVYCRLDPPKDLTLAAFVPDFRLSTEQARAALPAAYSREDAVFNIGRAALLTACLASGDLGPLRTAVDDRVHQPYRLPLIAHSKDVIAAARAAGSEAEFVSGSGPTIMALVRGDGNGFAREVSPKLAAIPGGWVLQLFRPDGRGAIAWVE
ncbi:MAG: homoserine kinase [Bacillota bacterium]|jgi:homoserine kinase|nr:homoserine kinase [Candidatus Fermentithermobacillaceae bacterium]